MGNFYTCGPDEALVVSGGWCWRGSRKRYVIGGYAYVWWFVSDAQYLTLETLTVYPYCMNVETKEGVAVTISAVAQCKIMSELTFLKIASEQFLGKPKREIQTSINYSLEGHLRSILGSLTIEEIYKDRITFSNHVFDVAAPDMARMGIVILSFTIKDIWDGVGYLQSLGKAQIADVKKNAAIGVAQSERDAGIREAECDKESQSVKFEMETRIENHSRMYQLAKSAFDQEVNTAKAQAALAYELQSAVIQQQICSEEVSIDIIERKKKAEVEAKEIERMDKELTSTVRLPAEADGFTIKTIAEGLKTQTMEEGKAEALKLQMLGQSEADVKKLIGNAEAQKMLLKAQVFKTYGNAATASLVMEALPKITSEISMPLKNVNEIVIIGGSDGVTSDLNRLFGQIPASFSALVQK